MTRTQGMPFKWALNPVQRLHARVRVLLRAEVPAAPRARRRRRLLHGDLREVQPAGRAAARAGAAGVGARDRRRRHRDRSLSTDRGPLQADRRCLEALVQHETPFSIVTKGPMVVRDIDLLVAASRAAGLSGLSERAERGRGGVGRRSSRARRRRDSGFARCGSCPTRESTPPC